MEVGRLSKAFSNLLKHIGNLSHTEKERVFQRVKRYVEPTSSVGGRQRYRCKCCSKSFSDKTNTVLYRTRKGDEWIAFVDCMFKG